MNNEISKYCNENDVEVYTVFAYTENYNHAHGTFLNRKAAVKNAKRRLRLYIKDLTLKHIFLFL